MKVLGLAGVVAIIIGLSAGVGVGITTAGTAEAISSRKEISRNLRAIILVGALLAEITAIYGIITAVIMLSSI